MSLFQLNRVEEEIMILIVLSEIQTYPQFIQILKSLKENEMQFRLIYLGSEVGNFSNELKSSGIEFKCWNYSGKGRFARLITGLLIELLTNKPKTIYTSGQLATLLGLPLSKLFRVRKRIFTRHYPDLHHFPENKKWIRIDKFLGKSATTVLAVSQNVKDVMVEKEDFPAEKILVVYNGIELSKFVKLRKSNDSKNDFVIGVASRLVEWKGIEFVVQAFVELVPRFENIKLVIVGEKASSYTNIAATLDNLNPKC